MTLPEKKSNVQLQALQNPNKTVGSVLRSGEPTLMSLARNGYTGELVTLITVQAVKFIRLNFPGTQNMPDVAAEFGKNLIEAKPDWKKDDVELFFKHISTNPIEITFTGNIITPMRLIELTAAYENARCDEREKILSEIKQTELSEKASPEAVKEHVEKIIGNINFLNKKPAPKDNTFAVFDPVQNEKDRNKLFLNIPDYSDEMLKDIYSSYFTSLHPPKKDQPESEFNLTIKIILSEIKKEITKRKSLAGTKTK